MFDFLKAFARSRYVGLLEGEVTRLRAENRALTNSLLGTAGFPPVEFPEPPKPQPVPRSRRRSWHQLQAWRENEAAHDAAGLDASAASAPPASRAVPHS
ncbi:MAG TPA: hypothetical protein VOA78_11155 [Candidatus Dormibacteraeota bacterium]|nr:hypothetical protein [Candidatus Dormibacteraeota bacterium]